MRLCTYCLSTTLLLTTFCLPARAASFRVPPYVQNPAPDGMSIIWFSNDETPGQLTYRAQDTDSETSIASVPVRADALAYLVSEDTTYFGGQAPPPPFRHRIRLDHLKAATTYAYRVDQGTSHFSATFNTAPIADEPIRFIAYADCETEPESTGKFTEWIHPLRPPDGLAKTYLLDQTTGYAQNLAAISDRHPNFIAIAGDLVESGGEQRDWDEFWLHNTVAPTSARTRTATCSLSTRPMTAGATAAEPIIDGQHIWCYPSSETEQNEIICVLCVLPFMSTSTFRLRNTHP